MLIVKDKVMDLQDENEPAGADKIQASKGAYPLLICRKL